MRIDVRHIPLEPFRPTVGGSSEDPRLASLVSFSSRLEDTTLIAIVGFPCDDGVRLNGGRPGAALAPDVIRHVFYSLTPDARRTNSFLEVARRTADLGNIKVEGGVADSQERLGQLVKALVHEGITPIIIGGGHETSFGHFLGYAHASRRVSILNFDAHVDVRDLRPQGGHSGSPFRQALEHESGACVSYSVAGAQPSRNARNHVGFVTGRGGHVFWSDEVSDQTVARTFITAPVTSDLMISIDMDVVDSAYAPGVSAPATAGLSPDILISAARVAGAMKRVTSMDIVEVNPKFDVDGRTSRLAAYLIWTFMSAYSHRIE